MCCQMPELYMTRTQCQISTFSVLNSLEILLIALWVSFFLCVHSSTQCLIVQRSPVEWQIEWTSDLDLTMSIVYSTGSSRVQLFNAVPTSYRAKGVQTAVPVDYIRHGKELLWWRNSRWTAVAQESLDMQGRFPYICFLLTVNVASRAT